ncbi:MAG: hypothetical protein ACI8XO_003753 [Verrucomicrobiales bacterium]|jgi:hypothetical protein
MTTPDFEALLKVLKKDRRRSNPDLYRIGFKNFPPREPRKVRVGRMHRRSILQRQRSNLSIGYEIASCSRFFQQPVHRLKVIRPRHDFRNIPSREPLANNLKRS